MQIQEQRLTRRLLNYWQLIRKMKDYPDIVHFNTSAVEDVWGNCLRLSLEPPKDIYRYEYMGDKIIKIYGKDLTGTTLEQATPKFPGLSLHQKIHDAAMGIPVEDEGHFLKENGAMVKYRACLLPFGNPQMGVTHVIIGLSCRSF